MENVILIVHLILALCLIGVVLLQRSEGGGLGLGGGGGGGGLVSARGAATALGKVTWAFAIAFICTSITLTIIAAQNAASGSVLDRIGGDAPATQSTTEVPSGESLLPPVSGDSGGLGLPSRGRINPRHPPRGHRVFVTRRNREKVSRIVSGIPHIKLNGGFGRKTSGPRP